MKILCFMYHKGPWWGHMKITDLAETLPNEYIEPIYLGEMAEVFFKFHIRIFFSNVEVCWFDHEIPSLIQFYLIYWTSIAYRTYAMHIRTNFSNFSLFWATISQNCTSWIWKVVTTIFRRRLCFEGDYVSSKHISIFFWCVEFHLHPMKFIFLPLFPSFKPLCSCVRLLDGSQVCQLAQLSLDSEKK